jgi:anaerobic magnesium-protoporphyrin IX monomethyl ester cyclase
MDKQEMQEAFAAVYNQREQLREDFARHASVEKDYFKHTLTAKVSFDIETWLKTGEVIEGNYTLVVYYPYKEGEQNDFTIVNQLSVASA